MFLTRNYPSDERYDLAKVINFVSDIYDVINSPLLNKFKSLPIVSYYDVSEGYRDLDQISQEVYNSPFYTYYIMFYNDLLSETVPEDTVLKMFSLTDLDNLYQNISIGVI